jgi:nucleoside-diphosphate-sugar epimerase
MRILVTGSRGNIGKHLVPYLRRCGHDVRETDVLAGYPSEYLQASVLNPSDITAHFKDFQPETVIHLAAMVSRVTCEAAMAMCYELNLMGTVNMIALCRQFSARLVHFSTSEIYGNIAHPMQEDIKLPEPNNRYGHAKWLSEKIVDYEVSTGLNAVILRPFMMYHEDESWGNHRSAMIRFCLAAHRKQTLEIHRGSERAWLHADDAVRCIEAACHNTGTCHAINIGSDEYIDTEDLARKICLVFNTDFEKLAIITKQPERMTLKKRPDLENMKNVLGIKPKISLDEGLQRIKIWLKKHDPLS